jgi:hypothetical protein
MKLKKGFSVIISFGKYGGFSVYNGFTKRLCLGWISIILTPFDMDCYIADSVNNINNEK